MRIETYGWGYLAHKFKSVKRGCSNQWFGFPKLCRWAPFLNSGLTHKHGQARLEAMVGTKRPHARHSWQSCNTRAGSPELAALPNSRLDHSGVRGSPCLEDSFLQWLFEGSLVIKAKHLVEVLISQQLHLSGTCSCVTMIQLKPWTPLRLIGGMFTSWQRTRTLWKNMYISI